MVRRFKKTKKNKFPTKLFFVFNPKAGNQKPEHTKRKIIEFCELHNLDYEIYQKKERDTLLFLKKKIKQKIKQGYRIIIAVGGDGTVSQIANCLYGTSARLAVIPIGTSNRFAREYSIPLEVQDALTLAISTPNYLKIPALQIGRNLFLLHVAIGDNVSLVQKISPFYKKILRRFAYLLPALHLIKKQQLSWYRLKIDSKVNLLRATDIVIALRGTLKEFLEKKSALHKVLNLNKDTTLIFVIKSPQPFDYLKIIGLNSSYSSNQSLGFFDVFPAKREISINSLEEQKPVEGDGLVLGKTPLSIKIIPRAINAIVPP